ncbi:MAG: hypothetical protein KAR44_11790 [Candidatus Aegiribacteria sp.]|nr:hypothetical protein [Candidatus Aegiribacteria sp.]
MHYLLIAFMISIPLIPVEVMDYPFSDDPVYLVYEETESGYRISLGTDFEGSIDPMTDYVDYPGLFNPTKAAAVFDVESRVLSVYSQYPFSANYYLATYRFDDDGHLRLLESGGHDYYFETLEIIEQNVDCLEYDEVINSTWSVMYPHANPYSSEMCILLLKAGLQHAGAMIEAGESANAAIECFDEINDVAWNLSGNLVHLSVQTLDNYPEELSISSEEYLEMLDEYADFIEDAGNSEEADNVRLVRMDLSDN